MARTNELTLLPKSALLITESADEFDALRDFEREIKPRGIIEQMYVHESGNPAPAAVQGGDLRPSAAHWSIFSCNS